MEKVTKIKLNYYYVPKKQRHKLNENVIPVEPIIATNSDFMTDLLLNIVLDL